MKPELTCFDNEPDKLIPRMFFVYNSEKNVFEFHIPEADIVASRRLDEIPGEFSDETLPPTLHEAIKASQLENIAGALTVSRLGAMTVASLRLNPWPGYNEVDPKVQGFRPIQQARHADRIPYYIDKGHLFRRLQRLSEMQYVFGVPAENYDRKMPEAPARFSLGYDYNHFTPTTIVTRPFENMLDQISSDPIMQGLANSAMRQFVRNLDSETKPYDVEYMSVGRQSIVSNGGDYAYACTSEALLPEVPYDQELSNYRVQSPDLYLATTHNSGITHEDFFVMLAVGTVNRLALDHISPGIIK